MTPPTFDVGCRGCGAATAYADSACIYCTRPTGRLPRQYHDEAPYRHPQPQPHYMGGAMIEVTTLHDNVRVFIPAEPDRQRRRTRSTGAR